MDRGQSGHRWRDVLRQASLLRHFADSSLARHTGLHAIPDTRILSDHEDLLVYEKTFDFARSKSRRRLLNLTAVHDSSLHNALVDTQHCSG